MTRPGRSPAKVRLHSGADSAMTMTGLRNESPVFFTAMVKVAGRPAFTVWEFGVTTTRMEGAAPAVTGMSMRTTAPSARESITHRRISFPPFLQEEHPNESGPGRELRRGGKGNQRSGNPSTDDTHNGFPRIPDPRICGSVFRRPCTGITTGRLVRIHRPGTRHAIFFKGCRLRVRRYIGLVV